MKVLLIGATGAIGRRLVPLLASRGHRVVAATHSEARLDALRAAGSEPVLMDLLDPEEVRKTVLSVRPEVVIHQATALAAVRSLRNLDKELAATNRLRTEGTENLLNAARAAGARRFVAQSFTGWPNEREGGPVKTEEDPLDPHPAPAMAKTLDAIRRLETMATAAPGIDGIVLRYGGFYGPGTSLASDGYIIEMVRRGRFPLFGTGSGIWSFIHIDDAAAATVSAVEATATGVFNVVDDEPAPVSVWLPELARILGAKPPLHLPAWLGRLVLGEPGMVMMSTERGSSNAKAKRDLAWRPSYASWRDGFRRELAQNARREVDGIEIEPERERERTVSKLAS
jgi:nucleoside-diphosphate-sugar epimerase